VVSSLKVSGQVGSPEVSRRGCVDELEEGGLLGCVKLNAGRLRPVGEVMTAGCQCLLCTRHRVRAQGCPTCMC
jgi:hypothetical protein